MKSDGKEPADIEGDNSRQSSRGPVSHVHSHCLLCNSQDSKPWGVVTQFGQKFEYLRCKQCGVVYKTPLPSAEALKSIYINYPSYHKLHPRERHAMIRRIEKIEKFAPKGKILDIGCGTGLLLDIADERGWDVYGVEPSQQGIEAASPRLKNKIVQGVLTKESFEAESFDVVVFWSVIEHINNPMEVLTNAVDLLKKNGILVMQTVNVDSLNARLFKVYWNNARFLDHVILWSRKSMLNVISSLGLEVIKLRYAGLPFPFGYNFRKEKIQSSSEVHELRKKREESKKSKKRLLYRFRHKILRSKSYHFLIKNTISALHLGDNIEVYARKT